MQFRFILPNQLNSEQLYAQHNNQMSAAPGQLRATVLATCLIYQKNIPTGLPAQPFPLTIKRHQTGHIVGLTSCEVWGVEKTPGAWVRVTLL